MADSESPKAPNTGEKVHTHFDGAFKLIFPDNKIQGLKLYKLGIYIRALGAILVFLVSSVLRHELIVFGKTVFFDCLLKLVNPKSKNQNNENYFLAIEYEEEHKATAFARFLNYASSLYAKYYQNIGQHFEFHFVVIYGPDVPIGPAFFKHGFATFHFIYLRNTIKNKLFKSFKRKIAKNIQAYPLEILKLVMLPRLRKFNKNNLTECLNYLFNPILVSPFLSGGLYNYIKSIYSESLGAEASQYWNDIERRYPVDNNYTLFLEEYRRDALKEGAAIEAKRAEDEAERMKAETASKLLDLGKLTRREIIAVVGKDNNWLQKLEADRKSERKRAS